VVSLPGLIKDGCLFSYQKIRALCGGGVAAGRPASTGGFESF